jgi:hypothetical protein
MSIVRNKPSSELRALVHHLGGVWSGDSASCHCPAHADRTPSLSIRQGDRGILVTCHAGCDNRDVMRAISRIAQLPRFEPSAVEPNRRQAETAHLAIWQAGRAIEGTLAERYVRDVRNIWAPLEDLRFHPRCPRGPGRLALFEPALLVAMRKAGRDRRDPADLPRSAQYATTPTSECLGQAIGAAWTNGPPGKTIGICEGFETAAAYTSLTGIQAWATMGAKRFHQVDIPSARRNRDPARRQRRRGQARARAQPRPTAALVFTIETEWPPGAHERLGAASEAVRGGGLERACR